MRSPVLLLLLLPVLSASFLSCERQQLTDEVIAGTNKPEAAEPGGIYVFIGGSNDGDFTSEYPSGREGADARCACAIDSAYPFISLSSVRGMISFKNDSLHDVVLPESRGMPVYGITPGAVETRLADSWNDLMDAGTGPSVSLEAALGMSGTWWTGSDSSGSPVPERCDSTGADGAGWDDNHPAPPRFGKVGSNTGLAAEWVSYSSANCNNDHFYLCVAY